VLAIERARSAHGAVDVVPVPGEHVPTWRIRYRRLPRPASYAALLAGVLIAYRKLVRQGFDPDVVHAHSFLSAVPALVLGALRGKPVVYTEHWTIFLPENPGRLSLSLRLAARLALRRADLVLPVSADLGDALHRLAPLARIRVVPNAVDGNVFRRAERAHPDDGRVRLLTAGLLDTERKGVDVLLEALALVPQRDRVRLDIVGDGANRAEYERLSERLGLGCAVTFHGLRTKPELAALMGAADVFVLASRYENNPCVLIEALACGLPIVATRVGGIAEVVDDDSGVLVEPRDPSAFAVGIEDALRRLDTYDRHEIARRALERYGRAAVAGQLEEIYAEVAAR